VKINLYIIALLLLAAAISLYYFNSNVTHTKPAAELEQSAVSQNEQPISDNLTAKKPIGAPLLDSVGTKAAEILPLRIVERRDIYLAESLTSKFLSIQQAANNGDVNAAYLLGESLQKCARSPRTLIQYNQAISTNLETPTSFTDEDYRFCKGITDEQLKQSSHYLEIAANSGDIESKIAFFKATPLEIENYSDNYVPQTESEKEYLTSLNDKKIKHLENAVKSGSIDAAVTLAISYNENTSSTITAYDIKKALNNLILAKLMNPDNRSITDLLGYLASTVSADEYDQAYRIAEQTFKREYDGSEFTVLH